MMTGTPADDADLSLLSWLQSLPFDTFATPFEQRSLQISVNKMIKPSTSFSEQIMTPMTPTPGSKTRMYPSPSPSTPTLYRGRPFSSSSRALSQSLTPNLESLLNQAKKKEDNGTGGDPGMLSRSLINMQLSGSSSARESLPTLTEGVEKPSLPPFSISTPGPSPSVPARFNPGSAAASATKPEVRNSSATAYEDFRQDRERAQRELQEREQRRKQLEDELMGGSTTPASAPALAPAPGVQPGATPGQGNGVTSPPQTGTTSGSRQEGIKIWNPTCHAISSLEDVQAIRAVTFDPTGSFYAVGSNSKTLRICVYPDTTRSSGGGSVQQPKVLFKRMRHHKGSIYCVAWSHTGNLVATGSNDKLVKLVRFDPDKCNASGPDVDLSFHDGTVRDLVFQKDSPSGTTLISAGAGDCSIYLTDCQQGQPVHAMAGHTGHVLSLYTWSGHMLASGSQDNTVRLWDVRTPRCIQIIGSPGSDSGEGSGAAAVAVDPSGRLLASGHEDSSCMLYDIHGGRPLQTFKSHSSDIRSLRFSPRNFYLMSGSYDCTIKLANLQGDITQAIPSATVAEHRDKVIQCRWHPSELSFLTSSADRTVTLWSMDNP